MGKFVAPVVVSLIIILLKGVTVLGIGHSDMVGRDHAMAERE